MEYDVQFIESIRLNKDVMSFRFTKPARFNFESGQYFILKLAEGMMKPFSFSNSPTEGDYIQLTTRMSGSDYKNTLMGLRGGEHATIRGPMGEFTLKPALRKLVFLAGGIGITPLRSMCKHITDTKADYDVILLWGNRSLEDAVFKDDFERMSKINSKLKVVHMLSEPPAGWTGYGGFITKDKIATEAPDYRGRAYYVCGPPKRVDAMDKLLKNELKIPQDRIITEKFGGY